MRRIASTHIAQVFLPQLREKDDMTQSSSPASARKRFFDNVYALNAFVPGSAATLLKLGLVALVLLLAALPALALDITVGAGCTLTDAINEAQGLAKPEGVTCADGSDGAGAAGHDTIIIPFGGAEIRNTTTYPEITTHITIEGNYNTINGGGTTNFFTSDGGAELRLRNLTLTDGYHEDNGGALDHRGGRLYLTGVTIKNGGLLYQGAGAIYSAGYLNIKDSYFLNNSGVTNAGSDRTGAINHRNADLIIEKSVFTGNSGASLISATVSAVDSAEFIIRNSTFYGNTVDDDSDGITISSVGGALTSRLHHLTVVGGGVGYGAGTHYLHNSILYGAATDCAKSTGVTLAANENNIIGVNECGGSPSSADPLLPASPRGSSYLTHFMLPANSPAVDAAGDCSAFTTIDQIGTSRPQPAGGHCDIGAYERPQAPRVNPRSGGGPSASARDEGNAAAAIAPAPQPAKPRVSTCKSLPAHIVVSNITPTTQCQEVAGYVIGNEAIAAVAIYAVDVWGWVPPDTQVCFARTSGSFKFIDTTPLPRVVYDSAPVGIDGMICTMIDRPGMVALLPGPPAPAATPMPPNQWNLSSCMVRTKFILNLRSSPGGAVIGAVPYDVTLTAMARTADWFKVDYLGTSGWVSNGYLEAKGNCG